MSEMSDLMSSVIRPMNRQGERFFLLGATLVFACVAQSLFDADRHSGLAFLIYSLSILLFVVLYRDIALETFTTSDVAHRRQPLIWEQILVALILGGLAFLRFGGNRFTIDGLVLWLVGLVLLGLALSERSEGSSGWTRRLPIWRMHSRGLHISWYHMALLGIMGWGAWYRLRRIADIPAEMGCDLPHIYNNILHILRGEYLIFFPSHPGREGLFFYWAAPICKAFGLNFTTIKISAALLGIVTIPLLYLLGKELYNREVGLYAAFFLATGHWHVILTRIGLRFASMPPVLVLMWYALIRGFKTEQRRWFVWAGAFLGLGFYTYNSFMIVPLLLIALIIAATLVDRHFSLIAHADKVISLVLGAIYIMIPLARYIYDDPARYLYRAATRITDLETSLPSDLIRTLFSNVFKTLRMFHWVGDAVFLYNVPFHRQLGFLCSILFLFGLGYVIWRWRHGYNVTVLLVLGIMLLPTIMSLAFPGEVPNVGRAIGALPAVVILAGVSLALVRRHMVQLVEAKLAKTFHVQLQCADRALVDWQGSLNKMGKAFAIIVLLAVLGLEARAFIPLYFRDYVTHLPMRNYPISLKLAQAIDDFWDDGETYIKIVPYWYDENALRVQLRRADPNWPYEQPQLRPDAPPLSGPPGKFMIILHPNDQEGLTLLQRTFPHGIALTHSDYDGRPAFITFYGER